MHPIGSKPETIRFRFQKPQSLAAANKDTALENLNI